MCSIFHMTKITSKSPMSAKPCSTLRKQARQRRRRRHTSGPSSGDRCLAYFATDRPLVRGLPACWRVDGKVSTMHGALVSQSRSRCASHASGRAATGPEKIRWDGFRQMLKEKAAHLSREGSISSRLRLLNVPFRRSARHLVPGPRIPVELLCQRALQPNQSGQRKRK